jgi:hypothetical protein
MSALRPAPHSAKAAKDSFGYASTDVSTKSKKPRTGSRLG